MKKYLFPILLLTTGAIILTSCVSFSSTNSKLTDSGLKASKTKHHIVYFSPEIFPDVEEIKFPSYQAFFGTVTDRISKYDKLKMTAIETPMAYDEVDIQALKEICANNNSDLAIVPKIKYFKVGIGKYVFSNQVIVSMKMYDAKGNFLAESSHDTFRKNRRMLGNTENSIKIGTNGVMNDILKEIRQINHRAENEATNKKELMTAL